MKNVIYVCHYGASSLKALQPLWRWQMRIKSLREANNDIALISIQFDNMRHEFSEMIQTHPVGIYTFYVIDWYFPIIALKIFNFNVTTWLTICISLPLHHLPPPLFLFFTLLCRRIQFLKHTLLCKYREIANGL